MCLHTIVLDPTDAQHFPPDGKLRVYRRRTGGDAWEALTDERSRALRGATYSVFA